MSPADSVVRWFDSHCHLQERYQPEQAPDTQDPVVGELERAVAAGVARMICIGTDPETSAQALALSEAVASGDLGPGLPDVWATLGLHPHDASAGLEELTTAIEQTVAAGTGRLVGIGECGLDYHYEHSPRDEQKAAFAAQIALAHRFDLTLVIHARDAWDDLFDVLGVEGTPARTVLHCFTGGEPEVRRCLDLGMYVSFSGIATFKNAPEVRAAAALCPLDRLLVETDSPFLAPVPYRGQVNEPSFVPIVGAALAEVRSMRPADLAESSWVAASGAFGINS